MVRAARQRSESRLYHVMARGVGRCIIFEDDDDRSVFLRILEQQMTKAAVTLHAWCLMDNHYHLLVSAELKNLSPFMRQLNSLYAQYFNERHQRVGHLFQGRFRSEAINTEEYFLAVLRYIHRNPIDAGLSDSCSYAWSSFDGYVDDPKLVDNQLALSMLGESGFAELHEEDGRETRCIDVGRTHSRVSNDEMVDIARSALGDIRVEEVAGLERSKRDEALRTLKKAHLSLRQIERLTGVSKSIVAEA